MEHVKSDHRWRERSLWLDGLEQPIEQRPSLQGHADYDVAIVGAGFTGLWSAYYLKQHQPDLRIAVIEREVAGFGPSGRNGGWVSSGIAGSLKAYGLTARSPLAREAERETFTTVDEIGAVAAREQISCDFSKQGMLTLATTAPQQARLKAQLAGARDRGQGEDDLRRLSPSELREYLHAGPGTEAAFTPHGARIDPARLVRGLAVACERHGVTVYEGTEVTDITVGSVTCGTGTIAAEQIVCATEAYTIGLPEQERRYLPLYSLMIATAPLSDETWGEIGWRDGLLIRDMRHLFFYAQRTADGRIAIGGRGAPYALGSPISEDQERNKAVRNRLHNAVSRHFGAAAQARITHHWGGPLAVPRDWSMSVTRDPASGVIRAGGYAGHGVVASNIAGRTVADLVLRRNTRLTSMPWVDHRSRNWEPEPLRFLASRAIVGILGHADHHEDTRGARSRSVDLVRPFMPPT